MSNSVFGFSQQYALQLSFGVEDLMLLDWFLKFAESGSMKTFRIQNQTAYWLDYEKPIADYPVSPLMRRQMARRFNRLCGRFRDQKSGSDLTLDHSKSLAYPLNKHLKRSYCGTQVYFSINQEVVKQMKSSTSSAILIAEPKPARSQSRQPHPINAHEMKLIEDLLSLTIHDGSKLFANRPPESPNNYTKLIGTFLSTVRLIHDGRFLKSCQSSSLFRDIHQYSLIGTDDLIADAAGNWDATFDLVRRAARRYTVWFDSNREPANKKYLSRSLDSWIWDPWSHSQGASLFAACCGKVPETLEAQLADRAYEGLPDKFANLAQKLLMPEFSPDRFWRRMVETYKWYKTVKPKLMKASTNASYWIGDLEAWLASYIDFLWELTAPGAEQNDVGPPIHFGNLGVECPTWRLFVTKSAKKHNIDPKIILEITA